MTAARARMIAPPMLAMLALNLAGCGESTPKTPPPQTRQTIRKTTQVVLDAEEELKNKGAVVADVTIPESDPMTQSSKGFIFGNVKAAEMAVEMRLNTWAQGFNDGKYPASLDEFMANIIKGPEPMALPMLPHYLEYGYSVPEHKLVILEYPGKKADVAKKNHDALIGH